MTLISILVADYESRSSAYRNQPITEEVYDEEGRVPNSHQSKMYDYPNHPMDRQQPYPNQQMPVTQHSSSPSQQPPKHSFYTPTDLPNPIHRKKIGDGMEFMSNRQRELIMQEQSGYGSDGSETLSVNSAQSMQKRSTR